MLDAVIKKFPKQKSHLKRNDVGRLDVKCFSLTQINMDGGMVFLCPPLCVLCALLIGQFILINNVFVPEHLHGRARVCVFGGVMHPCECVLVRHAFCPLFFFFFLFSA